MTITYAMGEVELVFNTETGSAWSHYYRDDRLAISKCEVVADDSFHAERLGTEPKYHRLAHELGHHLVGIYYYGTPSSPIVYHDAHGRDVAKELGKQAELEEWMVTALTYHAYGKSADYGALLDLHGRGIDVARLATRLRALVHLAETADGDSTIVFH